MSPYMSQDEIDQAVFTARMIRADAASAARWIEEISRKEAYAAAAALCREAGCCCDRLVDSTATYGNGPRNDGLQFRACADGSFLVQRFVEIHDPRCPHALAARIEALGGKNPHGGIEQ